MQDVCVVFALCDDGSHMLCRVPIKDATNQPSALTGLAAGKHGIGEAIVGPFPEQHTCNQCLPSLLGASWMQIRDCMHCQHYNLIIRHM